MPGFALPPPDPGLEMIVSQPGMSQGLSQTNGIQFFPRAFVRIGNARIGGQWRNLDSATANGVAALFANVAGKGGKIQFEMAARYRIKTGANGAAHSHAWEFSLGARRSFGRLGVRFDGDYSPDEFGSGPSLWVQAGPSFRINKSTEVSANIGRRERAGAPDYTALNAGISAIVSRNLAIDLRYFATDRSSLSERYRGRMSLSVRLAL